MDFGDLSDNPFALATQGPQRSTAARLRTAIKTLILVSVGLAATVLISTQSQRWLLHRYTADFEQLDSAQKRARLLQIADFGPLAIDPLVVALAEADVEVARTAYELLGEAQNGWTVLKFDDASHYHSQLVRSLRTIAPRLPDDRTGWGIQLLQQTIQRSIDRKDESAIALADRANEVLAGLSLSHRSGPSILSKGGIPAKGSVLATGGEATNVPQRVKIRNQPLPVDQVEPDGNWTQWPPRRESNDRQRIAALRTAVTEGSSTDPAADRTFNDPSDSDPNADSGLPEQLDANAESTASSPSLYRSSGMDAAETPELSEVVNQLRAIPVGEDVVLRDIDASSTNVQSVSHLAEVPMTTLDDKSVMHWLGSNEPLLREKAVNEMKRRGYSETEIHVASRIAAGSVATRIELAKSISHLDQIDPRPWLLMMLRDENRDVKLAAVSVLATFNDPNIRQQLQQHLIHEQDTRVAARIRKMLVR